MFLIAGDECCAVDSGSVIKFPITFVAEWDVGLRRFDQNAIFTDLVDSLVNFHAAKLKYWTVQDDFVFGKNLSGINEKQFVVYKHAEDLCGFSALRPKGRN